MEVGFTLNIYIFVAVIIIFFLLLQMSNFHCQWDKVGTEFYYQKKGIVPF